MRRVLTVVAALMASLSAGAVTLDRNECIAYGVWSADIMWARDVGADRERVRKSLIEMRDSGGAMAGVFTLLLRNLDALWNARMKRDAVMVLIVRDCMARGGRYGDGA